MTYYRIVKTGGLLELVLMQNNVNERGLQGKSMGLEQDFDIAV